jgi:hypothetical protein
MTPVLTDHTEAWIGFALFVASELLAMSKARDNSVLQLLLHMGRELFPYEVKRKQTPNRSNRPRQQRAANGQFTRSRKSNASRD